MTGVILAGGLNRRYPGLPKGLIEFKGKRLIERVRDSLLTLERLIIITNTPEAYFYLGIPLYGDLYDFRCPLTGIYTALLNSEGPILISACDMPFINPDIVRLIKDEGALRLKTHEAVIPVFNSKPQPLLGVYSEALIPVVKKWIEIKRCKMTEFLEGLTVFYIEEQRLREIDPLGLSFININRPEDILTAEAFDSSNGV
ncbi:MAG: molybdenum cofactor guanylyltransferase [Thermodesulfovibrionales bacterium]|nr:molybdenum cofactor guanylyltransferase [Thermodesulfovibrionales bacterium]